MPVHFLLGVGCQTACVGYVWLSGQDFNFGMSRPLGLLYRTIDLENYNNDLAVNARDGKTYTLTNNTIVVYDNRLLRKLESIALGRIYALDYVDNPDFHTLTFCTGHTGQSIAVCLGRSEWKVQFRQYSCFSGEGNINHF